MKYSREHLTLPKGPLYSERLQYRPLGLQDKAEMWEMISSPVIQRYVHRLWEGNYEDWLSTYKTDLSGGEKYKFFYGFSWQGDEEILGLVILRPTEDRETLEVGYWVREAYWGQGIATEANNRMILLSKELFDAPSEDLIAFVEIGNHASRRVLEKGGLRLVDKIEIEGHKCWRLRG